MILLKNKNKKANIKIGNNIEIKDGNDFPFDLTLYGKSTQETTQGKQLFNYEDTTMVTDGITVDEDGWITATFDNTNGTGYKYLNFYTNNLNLKNSTTYAIVSEIKSVSGTGFLIPVSKTNTTPQTGGQFNSEVSYNFATLTNNMIKIETPTTIDDFSTTNYGLRTLLQFAKGQSGSITFRLSVLEDTSVTADTFVYEKFTGGQPSPSPDYPSPIESVGRKNLFDISKVVSNWNSSTNIGVRNNNDGTLTISAPSTSSSVQALAPNKLSDYCPNLKVGDVVYLNATTTGTQKYIYLITSASVWSFGSSARTITQNDLDSGVLWYSSGANTTATISDIMISTDGGDYVPYEHTEISATVTGKNLFDGTGWRPVQSGDGFPKPATGATIVSSDTNNISFTSGQSTYAGVESGFINVKANETYMFSAKFTTPTNRFFITQYDENKTRISTLNYANVTTLQNTSFTTTNNGYIAIAFTNTTTAQTTYKIENIQLEKSTQATTYEQYKSNSLTIDLQGNELCSLPNGTKDEVNITNGEALLIKRVGKVVLDGSEDWAEYISQTSDGYRVYETTKPAGPSTSFWVNNGAYSNYFKATNGFNIKNSITGTKYGIYVNIDNTITNTIATFKTWLSTHNTEVLYELAEPETINLGTVEMPHTYEGVSNITNSADTEMIVKYYKKFEFDKILRSGYNIDEQEYEIAKKQMANGKRKKILSSYVDCIIKIDLGLLDNKTYQEYKEQLEDGEYEYWSYKYNQYKKANFILTKPSITTEYAYDDDIGIDDMEITLEKSSDVS